MIFPLTRSKFIVSGLSLISVTENSILDTHVDIRNKLNSYLDKDPSLAGPLLRLAFHDAASRDEDRGGPNGSIRYELERIENRGLARPFKVVDEIASQSSGTSVADIIALGGAVAVEHAGGPHIDISMGRKDVLEADPARLQRSLGTDRSLVETTLPSPRLDSDGLRLYFRRLGFTDTEWVALCGCHAMGRHVSLLNMPKSCLKNLTRTCLEEAPTLLPFVTNSVDRFDNSYFRALLRWNDRMLTLGEVAFIPTDVALVVDKGLRRHVVRFANDQELYFRTFRKAYQKLVC